MQVKIHADILREALSECCSAAALEQIIAANLKQDRIRAQFGHDEFHFDNNAFEKSYAYIEAQRRLVVDSLRGQDSPAARSAFGRLTHAAQDFYAHSNYIDLWLACQADGAIPTIAEVDPLDEDLIHSQALRSGNVYLPLEAFYFIKVLRPFVLRLLPRDSHAWMNLDGPEQGPNFAFAYQAAVKRTRLELEQTTAGLSADAIRLFVDH